MCLGRLARASACRHRRRAEQIDAFADPAFASTPLGDPREHRFNQRPYEAERHRALPDLNWCFEDTTLPLWEKHGIRQVGFGTTHVGPSNNTLTFILSWESLAARESLWDAFLNDPEWLEKRAKSEANGPLVDRIENSLLTPTAYSSLR
jgi:hypothetical protein